MSHLLQYKIDIASILEKSTSVILYYLEPFQACCLKTQVEMKLWLKCRDSQMFEKLTNHSVS